VAMKNTVTILKALGDETRLRIAALLYVKGELCVCEIISAIEMKQSAISKALRVLKEAGIINANRKAQWVYYSIIKVSEKQKFELLQAAVRGMKNKSTTQADLKKLAAYNKIRCKGE
jgi:ArsR family transcriptional regulator